MADVFLVHFKVCSVKCRPKSRSLSKLRDFFNKKIKLVLHILNKPCMWGTHSDHEVLFRFSFSLIAS